MLWLKLALILFSSAAVAWALTEAVKKTLKNRFKLLDNLSTDEANQKLWWTPLLVVVSIVLGFSMGLSGISMGLTWAEGGLTGALGGALATFLVSVFKGNFSSFLKKHLGTNDDDS